MALPPLLTQLVSELQQLGELDAINAALTADLASMTAERDALQARIDAMPAPPQYDPEPWADLHNNFPLLTAPSEIIVPPGPQTVFVPLEIDQDVLSTRAVAFLHVANATEPGPNGTTISGGINVGNGSTFYGPEGRKDILFHPGGSRRAYSKINIPNISDGQFFRAEYRLHDAHFGGGTTSAAYSRSVTIRCRAGAPAVAAPATILTRAARRLTYSGAPAWEQDMTTVEWSNTGVRNNEPLVNGLPPPGQEVWQATVAHETPIQNGNKETGRYMNAWNWPTGKTPLTGSRAAQQRLLGIDGRPIVRLHADNLVEPITDQLPDGTSYTTIHQASMINGRYIRGALIRLDEGGAFEFEVSMPQADYTWPALWFIGETPDLVDEEWPFEIDLYEGFFKIAGAYGLTWVNPSWLSAATHYGNYSEPQQVGAKGIILRGERSPDMPVPNVANVNRFTMAIKDGEIICFFNGIEYAAFPAKAIQNPDGPNNHFAFPMANVAVKRAGLQIATTQIATTGTDMDIYGMRKFNASSLLIA